MLGLFQSDRHKMKDRSNTNDIIELYTPSSVNENNICDLAAAFPIDIKWSLYNSLPATDKASFEDNVPGLSRQYSLKTSRVFIVLKFSDLKEIPALFAPRYSNSRHYVVDFPMELISSDISEELKMSYVLKVRAQLHQIILGMKPRSRIKLSVDFMFDLDNLGIYDVSFFYLLFWDVLDGFPHQLNVLKFRVDKGDLSNFHKSRCRRLTIFDRITDFEALSNQNREGMEDFKDLYVKLGTPSFETKDGKLARSTLLFQHRIKDTLTDVENSSLKGVNLVVPISENEIYRTNPYLDEHFAELQTREALSGQPLEQKWKLYSTTLKLIATQFEVHFRGQYTTRQQLANLYKFTAPLFKVAQINSKVRNASRNLYRNFRHNVSNLYGDRDGFSTDGSPTKWDDRSYIRGEGWYHLFQSGLDVSLDYDILGDRSIVINSDDFEEPPETLFQKFEDRRRTPSAGLGLSEKELIKMGKTQVARSLVTAAVLKYLENYVLTMKQNNRLDHLNPPIRFNEIVDKPRFLEINIFGEHDLEDLQHGLKQDPKLKRKALMEKTNDWFRVFRKKLDGFHVKFQMDD